MDFTWIGKIGTFAKQKNLIYAANYRIKTGQRLTDDNGNISFSAVTVFTQSKTSQTNSNSATDKARLASIKQKLKSGKKLSASEMSYLREKDEKLYKKAKYADDAREELKSELRAAKTKQEARQAVMRATAKIAADCSADFQSLQGGGGGDINFGAGMNFGGDSAISLDSGNLNVEGGENLSSGEFSTSENFSNGDISGVNSENISAENSVANADTAANENPFNQFLNSKEDSDSAFDILDKYLYAIRAIQDEWLEFIKSDDYKKMPEDVFERAEMEVRGEIKPKISNVNLVDALFAYQKSMAYGLNK